MKQIKKIQILVFVLLAIFFACNNTDQENNENAEVDLDEPISVTSQPEEILHEQEIPNNIPPPPKQTEVLTIVDDEEAVAEEFIPVDCEASENMEVELNIVVEQVEEAEEAIFCIVESNEPLDKSHVKHENNPVHNTEEYKTLVENEFKDTKQNPLSTFSIDVDNASYSNIRRFINYNQMPPKGSVRIEEMINYFDYDYPDANGQHPFNFITEVSDCPWNNENKVVHIGIQGKKLDYNEIKPSNLVFLLDVSGSMGTSNKLPLLKKSFNLLIDQLDDKDKISIVVYAGAAGLVLPPTAASEKETIKAALQRLSAGGSTAGGAGIKLAYEQAKKAFIKDGNNRVILATDGDFNVGTSSTSSLVEMIEEKRNDGIYLTILGLGMGNYKDGRMEEISNAGNGNYFYIDNIKEAEKVFVKDMRANLFTIAKDVKIQIEFNPAFVKSYRLIGYENRMLAKEDFNDDTKDAGELGAGHTVTALYEIVPSTSKKRTRKADKLKYQETKIKNNALASNELMTIKFRYKPPKKEKSKLIVYPIFDNKIKLDKTSNNFRFSLSVAAFGMLLRDSKHKGTSNYEMIENLAKNSKGKDKNGYRAEFITLVEKAKLLNSL